MSRYYDMRKSVRPRSYDELDRERMLMVGGPERCLEQIEEIADTGTNYIIFSMNFAGLEQKSILDSMAMMAEEVLPKLEVGDRAESSFQRADVDPSSLGILVRGLRLVLFLARALLLVE